MQAFLFYTVVVALVAAFGLTLLRKWQVIEEKARKADNILRLALPFFFWFISEVSCGDLQISS